MTCLHNHLTLPDVHIVSAPRSFEEEGLSGQIRPLSLLSSDSTSFLTAPDGVLNPNYLWYAGITELGTPNGQFTMYGFHDSQSPLDAREQDQDANVGASTATLHADREKAPVLSSSEAAAMLASAEFMPESDPVPKQHSTFSVFKLLMRRTFLWVILGISVMILGTGIVQGALLPRIHTCPSGASCPGSFNLNGTNVLNLLQLLMEYWLKIGFLIAGYGLLRLSAYQSWFIMMRDGNTIDNFELSMGAIKGSIFDAVKLLLKRGNRWLSLFVLAQIGVNIAINLLVTLSISRDAGELKLAFGYQSITHFPDSSQASLNSDGQLKAISQVISWALNSDLSHSHALLGTLVIPDGRSSQGVDALPGGPKLHGNISCAGVTNYTISTESKGLVDYTIGVGGHSYIAHVTMDLAVSMTNIGTALMHYLWVSNKPGIIPNATVSSDGAMYFALCNHTVSLQDISEDRGSDVQYIQPNVPVTSGCDNDSSNVCVSDAVSMSILSWWGGIGDAFWGINCRGNALGPLNSNGTLCPLTEELWESTASSMLDALVQTSPRSGHDTQEVVARVENLSTRRWWLQGVIPLLTLLLYFGMVLYTVKMSQGDSTFKELNLLEVIVAAQSDYVRQLVHSGKLGKTKLRYSTSQGFIQKSAI